MKNWQTVVMENMGGFPEPSIHLLRKSKECAMFCSLGNGHFFQALNLFRLGKKSIWKSSTERPESMVGSGVNEFVTEYVLPTDDEAEAGLNPALRDAVVNGIPALILRNDIPLKERTIICELLNKKSDYRWEISEGPEFGSGNEKDLVCNVERMKEFDIKQSQFELLSKVLELFQAVLVVNVRQNHPKKAPHSFFRCSTARN